MNEWNGKELEFEGLFTCVQYLGWFSSRSEGSIQVRVIQGGVRAREVSHARSPAREGQASLLSLSRARVTRTLVEQLLCRPASKRFKLRTLWPSDTRFPTFSIFSGPNWFFKHLVPIWCREIYLTSTGRNYLSCKYLNSFDSMKGNSTL